MLEDAARIRPSRITTTGLPESWLSRVQHEGADEQARHRALHQQPEITEMNVLAEKIKRRSDQTQNTGEDEGRAYGCIGGQSDEQHQRRDREAAAADSGQSHRGGDQESDQKIHHSAFSENV